MTSPCLHLLHQNEVNAIKWDPSGMLLASCSDDMTLKVKESERMGFVILGDPTILLRTLPSPEAFLMGALGICWPLPGCFLAGDMLVCELHPTGLVSLPGTRSLMIPHRVNDVAPSRLEKPCLLTLFPMHRLDLEYEAGY
ncbi:hypothetical protein MC885_014844, partial [Smutsia gigantea]